METYNGKKVIRFRRKDNYYSEFSNFYPCTISFDGLTYGSIEAAWQAQKTTNPNERLEFCNLNASSAKSKGRQVALRSDWDDVKMDLMKQMVRIKFTSDEKLKEVLLSTGHAILIEDTTGWHDNLYGECLCPRCINKAHLNNLGRILMEVREELREGL